MVMVGENLRSVSGQSLKCWAELIKPSSLKGGIRQDFRKPLILVFLAPPPLELAKTEVS